MWNQDNTNGFTAAQLERINAVREQIIAEFDGEEKSVDDALTNAWTGDDQTVDELRDAVRKSLGM
jgi:hypothetical protein